MSDLILKPLKNKSVNWENTENIYIEGDNLDALRILQTKYKNKVRVIYIDPPYNTGKKFVYKDNHKDWSKMIESRLVLSKDLLEKNGVIFISIGENEVHTLKNICDNIFGKKNFITTFIWEKTQHFGRQKLNAYSNAEYILCYAKQIADKKVKELLVEKISTNLLDAPLFNASNNISTLTFPPKTVKFNIKDGIYDKTKSKMYKLITPVNVVNGININEFSLQFRSRWSAENVVKEINKGTRFWIKTESFAVRAIYGKNKTTKIAPKQIIFTNSKNEHCTYSRFGEQVTTNEMATKELNKVLNTNLFDYPKPLSLISYLISLIFDENKNEFSKDFTVLDFFSGSGTTAHACMHLNSLDEGKRKFILVQKPDLINKPLQNKYKTLCDLGEERIKKAGEEISKEHPEVDLGFRVYKIECK